MTPNNICKSKAHIIRQRVYWNHVWGLDYSYLGDICGIWGAWPKTSLSSPVCSKEDDIQSAAWSQLCCPNISTTSGL